MHAPLDGMPSSCLAIHIVAHKEVLLGHTRGYYLGTKQGTTRPQSGTVAHMEVLLGHIVVQWLTRGYYMGTQGGKGHSCTMT